MFASIYSDSLIKSAYQHLLILVGFDTLIYRKYYDTPPILVGHQAACNECLPLVRQTEDGSAGMCIFSRYLYA